MNLTSIFIFFFDSFIHIHNEFQSFLPHSPLMPLLLLPRKLPCNFHVFLFVCDPLCLVRVACMSTGGRLFTRVWVTIVATLQKKITPFSPSNHQLPVAHQGWVGHYKYFYHPRWNVEGPTLVQVTVSSWVQQLCWAQKTKFSALFPVLTFVYSLQRLNPLSCCV